MVRTHVLLRGAGLLASALFLASCAGTPAGAASAAGDLLLEDYEGFAPGLSVAPTGLDSVTAPGTHVPGGSLQVNQGDKPAVLWRVSTAAGHDSARSLQLDWDNTNSVWLNNTLTFPGGVTANGADELSFWAQSDAPVSLDLTVSVLDRKGNEIPFWAGVTVKSTGDWVRVGVPLRTLSIPGWFKADHPNPAFEKVPNNPKLASVTLSPAWATKGTVRIDDVAAGKSQVEVPVILNKVRKPFDQVESFVCYYGPGNVEALSHFDVAIVEPRNLSAADIARLKASGTWVVGYITIGEDDQLETGDGKGPGGYASWFFDREKKGTPDRNGNWNSYYVDAGNPQWQQQVIGQRMKAVIDTAGCDGVFMDTIDTAELYASTKPGMVSLIQAMHKAYPQAPLVANRGLFLLDQMAPFISGLMYESFTSTYDFANKTYGTAGVDGLFVSAGVAVNTINKVRQSVKNFPVFCLDYTEEGQTEVAQFLANRAWEYDFLPYVTTLALDRVSPAVTPTTQRGVKAHDAQAGVKEAKAASDGTFEFVEPVYDPANLALAEHGTQIKVDSSFEAYSPDYLIDGRRNIKGLPWTMAGWASADEPKDHWIELTLPQATPISKVHLWWCYDNGTYKSSKAYALQYWKDGVWVTAVEVKDGKVRQSDTELPVNFTTDRVRYWQPVGGGPEYRANIAWIGEIELF